MHAWTIYAASYGYKWKRLQLIDAVPERSTRKDPQGKVDVSVLESDKH